MRRTAEKADTAGSSPREVIAFFQSFPPLTAGGHARLAFALLASGRVERGARGRPRAPGSPG